MFELPSKFSLPSDEFMQRTFSDFVAASSNQDTELVIDSRVLNAGGCDYKRLEYIQSWRPSFQHG